MMPAFTLSINPAFNSRTGSVPSTADVCEHSARLMEATYQIFAFRQIYAGFAAHGGVDLGKECGGHLHVGNPAHEDGGNKAANVAHYAAAEGDQQTAAIAARAEHLAQQPVNAGHCLVLLAGGQKQRYGRLSK